MLSQQSAATLGWTFLFGVLWGTGGLTFGLAMSYLGMSLGMGVALVYCAAFGTLLPPTFKLIFPTIPVAETITEIASTTAGQVTLLDVGFCLLDIFIAALAGATKEKEMPAADKQKSIAEFDFTKGILVATFSGIMSACFSFGLKAGNPIAEASAAAGTSVIWSGLPKLIVVMLGGFATNFVWCVALNIKNRTGYQYLASHVRREHAGLTTSGGSEHGNSASDLPSEVASAPSEAGNSSYLKIARSRNYIFSDLAGTIWYFQFFFTPWARRKWANLASLPGRFTWRASSFSARSGICISRNGKAAARRSFA